MPSLFDNTRNLSFYAVPAAWLLAVAPRFYVELVLGKKFDNTQPRALAEKLKNDQSINTKAWRGMSKRHSPANSISSQTKDRILRAEAAQQNGIENIGLFAAAVFAGNVAGIETSTLNWLSGGYLMSRVFYNILYVNNESAFAANTRSTVYSAGIGLIMTLFIKAGNLLEAHKRRV